MRVITLNSDNKVVGWKEVGKNYILGTNDMVSDIGELGQIRQADGTFINPEPVPFEPVPTLEEQIAKLQNDNLILMDALATVFEEVLNLEAMQGGTV